MAAPAAGRAGLQVRAGSAAGTAAGRTAAGFADLDFFFDAAGGLFEFDFEIVAQVGAATLLGTTTAAAAEKVFEDAAAARTENLAEEIKGVVEPRPGACPAAFERGVTVTVVGRPFVGIDQDVVGLRDLLEVFLCLLVARIAVRVVLHGELAVAVLDFLDGSAAGDPEDLVGVLAMTRRHYGQAAGPLETKTLAGRSRRSRSL